MNLLDMEEEQKQYKPKGGKREGSGRKSKSGSGESKFVSFRCSKDVWDILQNAPDGRTAYIEAAIREKHRREERY